MGRTLTTCWLPASHQLQQRVRHGMHAVDSLFPGRGTEILSAQNLLSSLVLSVLRNIIFLTIRCKKQNFCYITHSTMCSNYVTCRWKPQLLVCTSPHNQFYFCFIEIFMIVTGNRCQMNLCHRIHDISDFLWKTNFTHTAGCSIFLREIDTFPSLLQISKSLQQVNLLGNDEERAMEKCLDSDHIACPTHGYRRQLLIPSSLKFL